MSLIQELINLNLDNLKIQYVNSGERTYSFLLTTSSGKLVAVGWHADDIFDKKDYSFKDNKSYVLRDDYLSRLMSLHDWNTWPGELFLISNICIWHTGFNMVEPTGFIRNSLDVFVKNMKFNFFELRSASEISEEEIRIHSTEKEQLQSRVLLKSAKIEELQAIVKQLIIENTQLKEKLISLEESISRDSERL